MTRQLVSTVSMVDQVGRAIAKADGVNFEGVPPRYRNRLQEGGAGVDSCGDGALGVTLLARGDE